MKRKSLYVVESLREHGKVYIEAVCFTRRDAEGKQWFYSNEQTPRVRIVVYDRRARRGRPRLTRTSV